MLPDLLARIVLVCSILLASVSTTFAHAFLDHSDPGVGSTVNLPPQQIRIWFTEALDPSSSSITVTDKTGLQVGQGKAAVNAKDPMLLEITLLPLAPGKYRVTWRAVTVTTHRTDGGFTFTIAP